MPPESVVEDLDQLAAGSQQSGAPVSSAFAAGFANPDAALSALDEQAANSETPNDDTPPTETTPGQTPTEQSASQPKQDAPSAPLSLADVEAAVSRAIKANNEWLNGRIGTTLQKSFDRQKAEFEARLEKLQVQYPEISDAQIADVMKDFDELGVGEIGQAVTKLMRSALTKREANQPQQQPVTQSAPAAQPAQPAPASQPVSYSFVDEETPQQVDIEQEAQRKALSIIEPKWPEITGSQGFRSWLNAQGSDYANRINASWNAQEISGAIQKFKAAVTASQRRKSNVERAIQPDGSGGGAPNVATVSDAFRHGFETAMKR